MRTLDELTQAVRLGNNPGPPGLRRAGVVRIALSMVGAITVVGVYLIGGGPGWDTYAYWRAATKLDPYGVSVAFGSFNYSPPIVDLLRPFGALPWPLFYGGLTALSLAALVWMCRTWSLAALAFPPVAIDLYQGNIHLILAAMIVAGFRWSGVWAVPILTKVSPGVGLLWFAVRREWRPLTLSLAVTAAIVAASLLVQPGLWASWLHHLAVTTLPADAVAVPVPFLLRLLTAAGLVAWGAATARRWTVLVGAMWATALLGIGGFAMLAGLVPLWRENRSRADRRGGEPGPRPAAR